MPGFTYKSYNFTDKDPIIDFVRTLINSSHFSLSKIAEDSGVSQNTINKWLYGETKKPQAASINAVLRALDHKLNISRIDVPMMIVPTAYSPTPNEPRRKRLGAAKYSNVRHIKIVRRK
jgi:transcriptional regulator with XRE-family HTH domain